MIYNKYNANMYNVILTNPQTDKTIEIPYMAPDETTLMQLVEKHYNRFKNELVGELIDEKELVYDENKENILNELPFNQLKYEIEILNMKEER